MEKDFEKEYRKMQQMGDTSIYLLKSFEDDKNFMDAFQKQFQEAPLIPDASNFDTVYFTFPNGGKKTYF
jgi:hypothetical protein